MLQNLWIQTSLIWNKDYYRKDVFAEECWSSWYLSWINREDQVILTTESFVVPEFRNSEIPQFRSYVPNFKIRELSLCLENQYTIVGGNDIRGDGHMTNRWYWGEWQITLEGTDSWHRGGRTAGIRSNGQLILGGRTAYIRGDGQPTLGGTDSLH